jgi:hypothetical protein
MPRRPIQGKKLLVAGLGVGVLTFAVCGAFPGCNLMAPPSCEAEPQQPSCSTDMSVPEDLRAPPDLSIPKDLTNKD